MNAIIVFLLMIEFYVVLGFVYLITGMKKAELKPFYKLYDFWKIIIPLGILIFFLTLITFSTTPFPKEQPNFSIEISRDNEFEIIDILDELSKKKKKGKEIYINNITITYNEVDQISNIMMGVYIPKNNGYMYYTSDLYGDNLVFTEVGEYEGGVTIEYSKALIEEYHNYIKDIDSERITYRFKDKYLDSSIDSYLLENNELKKIDKDYILNEENLVVGEWNHIFSSHGLDYKKVRNIIV